MELCFQMKLDRGKFVGTGRLSHRSWFAAKYIDDKRKRGIAANYSAPKFASGTVRSLSRRFLLSVGFLPILSDLNLALGAPIPQMEDPEIIR
ncbi:Peptidyl-prolyl cis-trans isomerase FKBP16-1 chloroplastic [Bienertia sinuspersici]